MSHPIRVLVAHSDAAYAKAVLERLADQNERVEGIHVAPGNGVESAPRGSFDAVFLDLESASHDLEKIVSGLHHENPDVVLVGVASRLEADVVVRAEALQVTSLVGVGGEGSALVSLLPGPGRRTPFSGTIGDLPTESLFRLYGVTRMDGVLVLSADDSAKGHRRGLVQLENGQPVHATDGIRVGAPAVLEMLTWSQATVRWLPGGIPGRRTILGRWDGLLSGELPGSGRTLMARIHSALASESPEVLEKLTRLAQTQDVLAAFLLHRREIVTGRSFQALDPALVGPSLVRLAQVLSDLGADEDDREIQATVAGYRLVVDRVGPPDAHFQLGVVVRQAAPICKSLRRLFRQVDRAFEASEAVKRIGSGEATATPAFTAGWAAEVAAP